MLKSACGVQEEASDLDTMFSRGIDPDVDDPNKCHSHPQAPPAWPPKQDIVSYVQQVLTVAQPGAQEHCCHHLLAASQLPSCESACADTYLEVQPRSTASMANWVLVRHQSMTAPA